MKKLSTILLSSVVVLFAFSMAHAQTQDTALARVDTKVAVKKANAPATRLSENPSTEEVETAPQVKFIVPEVKERNSKNSVLDGKLGPNGEELQMDKGGFYYLDDAGKKVRVNTDDLKDKPKHS